MKIKLSNSHEFSVSDSSILSRISLSVESYDALKDFIDILMDSNNFKTVEFYQDTNDETPVGTYTDMKVISPLLRDLDIVDDKIIISFGIREKTETKKELEKANEVQASVNLALTYLADEEALTVKELFPAFESLIGQTLTKGTRLTYNGELYKTAQEVQVQEIYKPGAVGTESLYTHISDESHAGTLEDPIPAQKNMEYIKGKYYIDGDTIYLMNREGMEDGEGVTLQYLPSELIGHYFSVVE